MKKRPDLRIIISSATIDAEHFKVYFGTNELGEMDTSNVTLMSIEGRMHPVGESIQCVIVPIEIMFFETSHALDIYYLSESCADYVDMTVQTVLKIHHHVRSLGIKNALCIKFLFSEIFSELIEHFLGTRRRYTGIPYRKRGN